MTGSIGFLRREGTNENEEEELKRDDDDGDAGEGEEREGAASPEDASENDKIYGAINSGQGTTTTNAKSAKDDDDEEGRMVGKHQF